MTTPIDIEVLCRIFRVLRARVGNPVRLEHLSGFPKRHEWKLLCAELRGELREGGRRSVIVVASDSGWQEAWIGWDRDRRVWTVEPVNGPMGLCLEHEGCVDEPRIGRDCWLSRQPGAELPNHLKLL